MLADDETFDFQTVHQDERGIGQGQWLSVIARDHAADGDAAKGVHAQQHGVQNHAAHVFEVTIDAVGAVLLERLGQRIHVFVQLVIDAGVKAQLVHGVLAFFGTTGDTDDTAAAGFGQRSESTAHRARRGADHHGFARLGVDDLHQTVPGGHARHAHGAEVMGQRHMGGVDLAQRARLTRVHHAVVLPAAHADHLVASVEFGVFALHHLTHGATDHDFTQGLGSRVALAVVHAPAHVGVEAEKVVLDQHLAFGQCRCLDGHELEVVGRGFTLGAIVENDLLIGWHGVLLKGGLNVCKRD